jgi:hypothetical protein
MKDRHLLSIASILAVSFSAAHGQTIADWDFDNLASNPSFYNDASNTPSASIGSGTATELGMNNNYTYAGGEGPGSSAASDIVPEAGASTGANSYGWRIRGNSNSSNAGAGEANGWNSEAPIGTQGAQFNVSTLGYTGVNVSFDFYTTKQAEALVAFEYSLNGGSTWTDAAMSYSGSMTATTLNNSSNPNIIQGSYLQLATTAGGWYNDITVNLGGVADNNANFEFEIVNAATGTADINQSGTAYNNSSGNWQYDNVDVTGVSATPEPSTLALAGLGGLATLIGLRRNRKA